MATKYGKSFGLLNVSFFVIFFGVIVLYIHIAAHFNRSENLEIYETDFTTNPQLQNSCNLKQPLLVFSVPGITYLPGKRDILEGNEKCEGNIRDLSALKSGGKNVSTSTSGNLKAAVEISRERRFPMGKIQRALESDNSASLMSENNCEFIEDSVGGLWKILEKWGDERFKPTFTLYKKYDILSGSRNCCSPLRYHTAYRKFLVPRSQGSLASGAGNPWVVRLTPFKSRKRMEWIWDDLGIEGVAAIDAFSPASNGNVRFIECILSEGQVLSIPPYWWYSIKFPNAHMFGYSFTYWSVMNCVANSDIWMRYIYALYLESNSVVANGDIGSAMGTEKDTDLLKMAVELRKSNTESISSSEIEI